MSAAAPAELSATARRVSRAAPLFALAYALGVYAVAQVTVDSAWLAMGLSLAGLFGLTALALLATAGWAAMPLPRWVELVVAVGGAKLWHLLTYRVGPHPPDLVRALAMLAMIAGSTALGRVIVTWLLREKNLLPIALAICAGVDVWGVNFGFTGQMLQTSPETVAKASASLGAVKTTAALPGWFHLMDLTIGPGDILFMALVLALVVRHDMGLRRNLVWMYWLVLAGLLVAGSFDVPIPGLVFIGASGLLANRGQWTYTREEKRSLVAAAAIMVPLLVGAGFWLRAHAPVAPPPEAAAPAQTDEGHGRQAD